MSLPPENIYTMNPTPICVDEVVEMAEDNYFIRT